MTLPVLPRLFAGIRATNLPLILVGPGVTRRLASTGPEVVGVAPADPARVDLARYVAPFLHDTSCRLADPYGMRYPLADRVGRATDYYNNHAGKCGMRLNVQTPEGQALFRRCVAIGRCGDGKISCVDQRGERARHVFGAVRSVTRGNGEYSPPGRLL